MDNNDGKPVDEAEQAASDIRDMMVTAGHAPVDATVPTIAVGPEAETSDGGKITLTPEQMADLQKQIEFLQKRPFYVDFKQRLGVQKSRLEMQQPKVKISKVWYSKDGGRPQLINVEEKHKLEGYDRQATLDANLLVQKARYGGK